MAKYLSKLDVWAIAFGCIVGWGAFVMPGTTFLPVAGPAGSIIAMILCVAIMLVIGRNYSYLMEHRPGTGGVYSYTKEAFGRDHAFLCSWFVSLSYLTIVFLNATALFVICRTVFGDVFQVGFHYQILGYEIYAGEIGLTALLLAATGIMFVAGKPLLQRLQTIFAVFLLVGILTVSALTIPHADPSLLLEFSGTDGYIPIAGIALIVILAPWAFVGFDIASLETAHFDFSTKKSWKVVALSILAGGLSYLLLTVVSVSFIPAGFDSWQSYVVKLDLASGLGAVPTFFAAKESAGSVGVAIISLTALAAILTGIIGSSRAMIRMLSTMAEDKILSKEFLGTTFCILFVVVLSLLLSLLGRNALNWFVELTSFGAIIGFGYTSAAAARIAGKEGDKSVRISGIVGTCISIAFVFAQLVSQIGSMQTMSAPSFLLLALWCLVGFVFYWRTMRQQESISFSGSSVSGIALFCLLFYSALMWFVKTLAGLPAAADMQDEIVFYSVVFSIVVAVGLAVMLYVQRMIRLRQDELERKIVRAEESSKAKSRFLFNMSHDIRTPMNAIIGYTHLAQEEPDVSPRMRDYIDKIDISGRHLLALIDDVLEMSRIESNSLILYPRAISLPETVNEIASMIAVQMDEKGIAFEVKCEEVSDPIVMCDKNRLIRIIQNLMSNAYKFTPEGGSVSIALYQLAPAEDGRASYRLSVSDTGIGMSSEFLERVFDEFERERTSTASGVQGTGLGMAITKNIVDMMGGTINVESELGKGTTFTVDLTFDTASERDLELEKEDSVLPADNVSATHAKRSESGKLLVVDDSLTNREIIRAILEGNGFTVDTADDGKQAVEALESAGSGAYDAVLMDVQMPVMDGYEAAEKIRAFADKDLARIPIIAVTANAFEEDVEKSRKAGMNAHIAKPVDPEAMVELIFDLLDGRGEDDNA